MDSSNDFNTLLCNLMNTDNEIRANAETLYENVPPSQRAQLLLYYLMDDSKAEEIRQLAAVLLRRLLFNNYEEIVKQLPDGVLDQMKSEILLFIPKNISNLLRKKVCDVAAEVAKYAIDDDGNNHWPQFLNFLFDCVKSPDPSIKECALNMFTSAPGVFGNQQNKYLDVIKQMLVHCLNDSSINVKIAAVKATTSFILAHEAEKNILKSLNDCILPMIQVTSVCIDEEVDDSVLKSLIDIAEKCPQILRSQFELVIQVCLKSLTNPEGSDSFKNLALEIIISLAENASATFRKRGSLYFQPLVFHLLLMMTDLPEDANWSISDNVEDEDDNESNAVIGESSLDRLACAIGGKLILPLVINNVSTMLNNTDWKHRFAGLMAISAVGEGCQMQMKQVLKQILDAILPFLNDHHPRVRYAACNALGQLATDFSPDFEEMFHPQVVPGLLALLNDYANPRVQAHAGAALVNFFEECSQKIVVNYMDAVVLKIEEVLNNKVKELMERGTKLVLEQIVVTLASLADSAQENFQNYYDKFMPCLKYIIQNATSKELRMLRGKCIECVSLIGLAVGKEKFCADASEIMKMLLETQTGQLQLEDDDPQLAYMISAWARICKILGRQFEPYLPFVMGPVLKTAALKIEVALLDSDDMKVVEEDSDWQCVSLGDQQMFGIKTAGLEEKATACQMLVCYARELKESFASYVEETAKIMVPLLKFYFHDGVRIAAAESLPFLLDSAKVNGEGYVLQLWNFTYPELLKAIEAEPEKDVLSELMTSLASCIEKIGSNCLNEKQIGELISVIDLQLKQHFERYKLREEKRKDEDYDDGVEAELLDEDDEDVYILSKVADVLHSLFIIYKHSFYPYFDSIFQQFIDLAVSGRPWTDLQWAICVMDDVIEHGGQHSVKYQHFFLPLLLSGLQHQQAEIRQAAAYGWGVLGKFGTQVFAKACADCLPYLIRIIEDPNSRLAENITATENAISAVTKILQFNNSQIDTNHILSLWLSWLPVWEDEEELPHVYGFLFMLLESNNPIVTGNTNLPRIISIFAEVFARSAINPNSELGQKMVAYLKFLKMNESSFSTVCQHLTVEQQQALNQIIVN